MSFTFEVQSIPAVILIHRRRHEDDRGTLTEFYKKSRFAEVGLDLDFVQDNQVSSTRHVLRGLHYQLPPAAQGKLVSVTRGRVLDVAVDLRREEPTYRRWVANELSGEGGQMVWIPPGFAHGYLVLSDEADVHYKATAEYAPGLDRGIRWDDPSIGIPWPTQQPHLSEKDRHLPFLPEAENPF